METEFIYWRHITLPGIKVEEVTGHEQTSGKIWLEMARQIYCENGHDGTFRQIGHTDTGMPLLLGEDTRISITHTGHLLAVATLPRTPEANLSEFSERTAMGIDAEKKDRKQVIAVREKFLTEDEMAMIPADDVLANVIAWTSKEALYKAAQCPGADWRRQLIIRRLPAMLPEGVKPAELAKLQDTYYGEAVIIDGNGKEIPMSLFSYSSEDYCITLAFSPKCAKYKKG